MNISRAFSDRIPRQRSDTSQFVNARRKNLTFYMCMCAKGTRGGSTFLRKHFLISISYSSAWKRTAHGIEEFVSFSALEETYLVVGLHFQLLSETLLLSCYFRGEVRAHFIIKRTNSIKEIFFINKRINN